MRTPFASSRVPATSPARAGISALPIAHSTHIDPVTKGIVTTFDTLRGIGYVRHHAASNLIPFAARDVLGEVPQTGDPVEYSVVGGKVGVAAKRVRRLAD